MSQDLALLRIEHKLDLLLAALQVRGEMLPAADLPQLRDMGGLDDFCPVCAQNIRLDVNYLNESMARSCGCVPPITLVSGVSGLMTPPRSTSDARRPSQQDPVVPPEPAPRGAGGR